jgi:ribosomal-protein-alanine N-acetyltransferase
MTGHTFIETDRLTLRPLEREDVSFLRRCQDPSVRQDMPILNTPTSREGWEEYVERTREDDSALTLLVEDDDGPIGEVMFRPLYRNEGRGEFGIWLVPEVWGKGYAKEACTAMLRYGFEELRLHRVSAKMLGRNDRSRGLLESVGFTEEGVLRESRYTDGTYHDEVVYALLEDEWRESTERDTDDAASDL